MAFVFDVKVVPSAGRKGWILDKSGNLKCFLKSPAEQGKANDELVKGIAKLLHITHDMVSIVSGKQSRNKRIKVELDLTYARLLELLSVDRQISMFSQ
jgi:uncharacterized protein